MRDTLYKSVPEEINLFYLDESGRDRIISQNGHFKLAGRPQTFEPDEIFSLTPAASRIF